MRSPEELRAEVSRLVDQIQRTKEVSLRQSLAARALELAQEAEAIASLPQDVEGLRLRIAQTGTYLVVPTANQNSGSSLNCCEMPRTSYSRSAGTTGDRDSTGSRSPDLYSLMRPARLSAST